MATLIFDTESNSFARLSTVVHSLVIMDFETENMTSLTNSDINVGVDMLSKADMVIGHNIIGHDLPLLRRLYNLKLKPDAIVIDTILLSRLFWPSQNPGDFALAQADQMPFSLMHRHSLEAWGYRLGLRKGDYGGGHKSNDNTAWAAWSPEMQTYCEQDVRVTAKLWKHLSEVVKKYSAEAINLEHEFAQVISLQQLSGFGFNTKAATVLVDRLRQDLIDVNRELAIMFPDRWESRGEFTPSVGKPTGKGPYVCGAPLTRVEYVSFNPGSRFQISDRLIDKYGWVPTQKTEKGSVQIDESVLAKLPYPEAKLVAKALLLQKRLSQISDAEGSWIKLADNDVIYGSVITNGAVTGRCTHRKPNITAVPSVDAPYGTECRSLFGPTKPGWKQIGVDAKGLELRCLAHYLTRIDDGAFGKILLTGDPHWNTVQSLGLHRGVMDKESRVHHAYRNVLAKRFIYAFLYGAGGETLGMTIYEAFLTMISNGLNIKDMWGKFFGETQTPDNELLQSVGNRLKRSFLKANPALKTLLDEVSAKAKDTGCLKGIDGRILTVRSQHSAFNLLLQSCGSIVVKRATVINYQDLLSLGLEYGHDWTQLSHNHDEFQLQCRPEIVDTVKAVAEDSFRKAGEYYKIRIPMEGEAKIGNNWAECH